MAFRRQLTGAVARWRVAVAVGVLVMLGALPAAAGAFTAPGHDALVSVGNPYAPGPFSQNKQNEPAVAIDAIAPSIVAAGANEEIDMEACRAGLNTDCPFTDGVGVSGIYLSTSSGSSWTQPSYSGYTARQCLGDPSLPPDSTADACQPQVGRIGTLPNYYEAGLVSDGDPALAFGPRRLADGRFSWLAGSRLYYANLASAFPGAAPFKGFEAVYASYMDATGPGNRLGAALGGDNSAWSAPRVVSKQNAALFSDKEQIWADNAASSRFFGNVYICNVGFRSVASSPEPVLFARSTDAGATWRVTKQLTAATNNTQTGGRQGCAVRTDSQGVIYVVWVGTDVHTGSTVFYMARSFDGGSTFEQPRIVARVQDVGQFDPATSRFSFDGVAGARTWTVPSLDIANGAPTGYPTGHTDQIVLAWSDGPTPIAGAAGANEQALVSLSSDHGLTWTAPVNAAPAADRPDFTAIAISPNGRDLYLTYDNFTKPWQPSALSPSRPMQGVVRHADTQALTAWTDLNRGPLGDARGSSQNGLTAEFLGDYNYVMATNRFGVAVWNDVRNAAPCQAINQYRQAVVNAVTGGTTPPSPPDVQAACPLRFGNTDIYSGSYLDPTP